MLMNRNKVHNKLPNFEIDFAKKKLTFVALFHSKFFLRITYTSLKLFLKFILLRQSTDCLELQLILVLTYF